MGLRVVNSGKSKYCPATLDNLGRANMAVAVFLTARSLAIRPTVPQPE
jgi:hypothetical protein